MMIARAVALLMSVMAGSAACRQTPPADAAQLKAVERAREQQLSRRLAAADANPKRAAPVAMWIMAPELREISGLALTGDGRLLAHDDNVGTVYVLDARHGVILKHFTLKGRVRGDFESIAVAGSDIYLLASNGRLYQFKEGSDGAEVPYTVRDFRLGHECEFESMAYEPDSSWLLMPCKNVTSKGLHDQLVIYRWRLQGPDSARLSMSMIPLASLIGSKGWKSLHPSDMTIDPKTGNYVIITSHEKALIEITPGGELVRSEPLPGKHSQPEGVAITTDGLLIVSDEANRTPAAITVYRWRR